jgi:hypothetical protein
MRLAGAVLYIHRRTLGLGAVRKIKRRIQFFGYNAARSARRPLEKTEKFRLGTKAAGGTAVAETVFSVSAFSVGIPAGAKFPSSFFAFFSLYLSYVQRVGL